MKVPNLLKTILKVLDGKFNRENLYAKLPFTHLTWDGNEIIIWDDGKAFPVCAFIKGRLKKKLTKLERKLYKKDYPSFTLKRDR